MSFEYPTSLKTYRHFTISAGGETRWITTLNPKYGYKILSKWQPYSLSSRLIWWIFLKCYKYYIVSAFLVIKRFLSGASFEARTADLVEYIAYVGTPGLTQKLVISVLDNKTRKILCIEKIGIGDLADDAIKNEVNVLSQATQQKEILCPRIIDGACFLGGACQSYLEGIQAGTTFTLGNAQQLLGLVRRDEFHTLGKKELLSYFHRDIFTKFDLNYSVEDIFAAIFSLEEQVNFPVSIEHGDYAPWNILVMGSRYGLVDWECGILRGFPLFDVFHFVYTVSRLVDNSIDSFVELRDNENILYLRDQLKISEDGFNLLNFMYIFRKLDECNTRGNNAESNYYNRAFLDLAKKLL